MSLFLSQIEPEIKRELYRRIDISSFDHPSTRANITEPVKADISRHWYSIRKPWIRFTSGALVGKGEKFEGTQIYQEYEEESAMKNVLFGGILNSETFNDSSDAVASNREPYYRAKKSAFKGSGLRGAFDNTYKLIEVDPPIRISFLFALIILANRFVASSICSPAIFDIGNSA